jgi:hypothetical protein
MTEYLQDCAGDDPKKDKEYSSYIRAAKDILNISLDEIEET